MIHVFGVKSGLESFHSYLRLAADPSHGVPVYSRIAVAPYGEILDKTSYRFFETPYVFTDVPHLSGAQIGTLGAVLAKLRESPVNARVLNNPVTYKGRYEALRILHEAGVNDHNVYRVSEHRRPARWPVFVRHELGHWMSPLLPDQGALDSLLAAMAERSIWLGAMLIVEWNDFRSPDGLYRKYAAFRIGDRIFPHVMIAGPNWYLRFTTEDAPDMLQDRRLLDEEYADTCANPRAQQLRPIFDRLGIQYGRMDYALVGDRVQVFEINSSPIVMESSLLAPEQKGRRRTVERIGAYIHEAFEALDEAGTERGGEPRAV